MVSQWYQGVVLSGGVNADLCSFLLIVMILPILPLRCQSYWVVSLFSFHFLFICFVFDCFIFFFFGLLFAYIDILVRCG